MIRVGPAGWSYADWEGIVYPRKKGRGFHALPYLARYVDCVEINSSFYHPNDPRHAERWAELVSDRPDFRFLAKLHGELTHGAFDEQSFHSSARACLAGLAPLASAGRLSALLAQFPVTFTRTELGERRLEWIAEHCGPTPLAVELRHRSWFDESADALLTRLGLSRIHIDLPAARDHPPPWHAPTGPIGYLRVHGRNARDWFRREAGRDERYDYLYSPPELDELAARANRVAGEHDQTFVVTNNHFEGQAVANALELEALLRDKTPLRGEPVAAPRELVERYPRLAGVTRPEGQGSLF